MHSSPPPVLVALLVAACPGAVFLHGCRARPQVTTLAGPTMGARYAVTIAAVLSSEAKAEAATAVERELASIDALMSNWRTDSEVERLNRSQTTSPIAVSRDLAELTAIARRVSEMSAGAFDVTVAPVVRAWGFGPSAALLSRPSDSDLARAASAVGYRLLDVEPARGRLVKRRPEVSCDFSGIAPGFAADRIAEVLASRGYADVLVDIGGEIRTLGHRPGGGPWRVAVAAPERGNDGRTADELPVATTVGLSGLALATSGDYRDFRVDGGGRRLTHIIDPRTSRPVGHGLASATVVRATAAEADALATALMVLGPDEGMALAERERLAAYFIVRLADGSFEPRQTRAFAALRAD